MEKTSRSNLLIDMRIDIYKCDFQVIYWTLSFWPDRTHLSSCPHSSQLTNIATLLKLVNSLPPTSITTRPCLYLHQDTNKIPSTSLLRITAHQHQPPLPFSYGDFRPSPLLSHHYHHCRLLRSMFHNQQNIWTISLTTQHERSFNSLLPTTTLVKGLYKNTSACIRLEKHYDKQRRCSIKVSDH
jgi:hypothetical protein